MTQERTQESLESARRAIDRVDGALQAALMTRARLVRTLAPLKKDGSPVRLAREAQILRGVLGRYEPETLPFGDLFTLWREILMAMVRLQQPGFQVAVCASEESLATVHFTPRHLLRVSAAPQALQKVAAQEASLAILPFPEGDAPAWWAQLGSGQKVVGCLPCVEGMGVGRALVVGAVPFEPSGDDVSLLTLPSGAPLPPGSRLLARTEDLCLVQVGDYLQDAESIGGYPRPVRPPRGLL